ncbi:NADPH2:quinone reductase [Antricoccus suffuscus]|uniref:NADPH2:quinone reductase n=1 Tax=Antricoccus suffuscus TaxID=1629062 RepID=A0A2T1A0C7_9ACTN|nr:NADPH:quinone oxidoreductase family protein [Antricoccus suffuscus]PRZ41788.1 NADPH2:quinone reductase [Antricoccus suffuscus]
MRAWQVGAQGEPGAVMTLTDLPEVTPGDGQLAVRVRACSLGFPDVLMCRGEYQVKPDLPFVPGTEICADVIATGPGVVKFAVGDRILGSPLGAVGGLAELAIVNEYQARTAPEGLDDAEAASLLSAFQTGWIGLHRRCALRSGEYLLVHAAAGGVGNAAVQLGIAAGATVIGVTRGQKKAALVRGLGAHLVIDRTKDSVIDEVKRFTGGHGADVVYDPVGGDSYAESTKCIAFEGRILLVGFAGGEIQSQRLNHPLIKNYSILGLHAGLYTDRNRAVTATAYADLVRLVGEGKIRPLVGRRVDFSDAAEATQELADGKTTGRSVVMFS